MTIVLTGCDYTGKTYFLSTLICLAKKISTLFEPDCDCMQSNIEISNNCNNTLVDTLYIKNCLLKHFHPINVKMVRSWEIDIKFSFRYKDVPITFIRVPEDIYTKDYALDYYFRNADGMLFFLDGISLFLEYTKQIQKGFNTYYPPNEVYDYVDKNHLILLRIIYYWKQFSKSSFKTAIIFSKSDCFDFEIDDYFKFEQSHLDKKVQDHFLSFLYNIKGCFPKTHFFQCNSFGAKKNPKKLPVNNILQILDFLIN